MKRYKVRITDRNGFFKQFDDGSAIGGNSMKQSLKPSLCSWGKLVIYVTMWLRSISLNVLY